MLPDCSFFLQQSAPQLEQGSVVIVVPQDVINDPVCSLGKQCVRPSVGRFIVGALGEKYAGVPVVDALSGTVGNDAEQHAKTAPLQMANSPAGIARMPSQDMLVNINSFPACYRACLVERIFDRFVPLICVK